VCKVSRSHDIFSLYFSDIFVHFIQNTLFHESMYINVPFANILYVYIDVHTVHFLCFIVVYKY